MKKYYEHLEQLLDQLPLRDGMTVSFHHHLRNGDGVLNMVMLALANRGYKDLTLFASSLFPCHEPIVKLIEDGTITRIYTAYCSGPVAEAISSGKLKHPVVMHTHGGRVRLVDSGDVTIDIAFIASPAVDYEGNITGSEGKNACGSLGYAMTDAKYASIKVAITDTIQPTIQNVSISGDLINYVLKVNSIGDREKIVSGTTQLTRNPIGLKIAQQTVRVMEHSGFLKDGFSFQTGAGGISLAVADGLRQLLHEKGMKGRFASGGITGYIVRMLEEGLIEKLYDVQCFDLEAVRSIKENPNHIEISASKYAYINDDCVVNDLDFVILGATEIDTNFNVNVTTSSTGIIMGGSGGHSDTAQGAKVTIVVSQLFNARIPVIRDQVTCNTTPGNTVDVLVTERGIAVNPNRPEIEKRLRDAKLPVTTIERLKALSDQMLGVPDRLKFTDQQIGIIEYRDGSIIDRLYQKR